MTTNNKNILYCSFCGKSQHEVRKLIAGPTVFICDECVELCMDIIKEENKSSLIKHQDGVPTPKEICNVLDDYLFYLHFIHIYITHQSAKWICLIKTIAPRDTYPKSMNGLIYNVTTGYTLG